MKLSQLVRARIVIGELLKVISWDNRNVPEHWSHEYKPLAEAMIHVGSVSFANDSIASHIGRVFTEEEPTCY